MDRFSLAAKPSNRRRRGNTIIESALIFLPLFTIVFAIIDFSMVAFVRNTMHLAVREGARYAITSQTMAGLGHDDSIKTVVQRNAMGFLNGSAGLSKISVDYYDPKTLALVTGVSSNRGGNIAQISVNGLTWAWIAPLQRAFPALSISASSSDLMEQPKNGIIPNR